jgi:hypothetical protein
MGPPVGGRRHLVLGRRHGGRGRSVPRWHVGSTATCVASSPPHNPVHHTTHSAECTHRQTRREGGDTARTRRARRTLALTNVSRHGGPFPLTIAWPRRRRSSAPPPRPSTHTVGPDQFARARQRRHPPRLQPDSLPRHADGASLSARVALPELRRVPDVVEPLLQQGSIVGINTNRIESVIKPVFRVTNRYRLQLRRQN